MSQPNGSKVVGPCRYCGERYRLTNWMRRNSRRHEPQFDDAGNALTNTHLIACWRKKKSGESA